MREDVGFSLVHQHCDLREAFSELIGDRTPLSTGFRLAVLREDGADEGGHHLALARRDVGQDVSHEVHPAEDGADLATVAVLLMAPCLDALLKYEQRKALFSTALRTPGRSRAHRS